MPYRIALTSSDGKFVDLHFGHAEKFSILSVDEQTGKWELLEQRLLDQADTISCPASGSGACHGHNDERLNLVIKTISDCQYVLTSKIGPKPQEILKRAGITALESPADINFAVSKLHVYHLKYADINREK
jgi:predicted Fe-Mo cluster-binding NifX family protein